LKRIENMKHTLKKNGKQKKLKSYFRGNKPKEVKKRVSSPKNFQGFPISKCHFVTCVGDHCYMPPKYYGTNFDPTNSQEFKQELFCSDCMLAPCFMTIHQASLGKELLRFAVEIDTLEQKGHLVATREQKAEELEGHLLSYAKNELGNLFTKKYVKSWKPECILSEIEEMVSSHYQGDISQKEEKEDSALVYKSDSEEGISEEEDCISEDEAEAKFSWDPSQVVHEEEKKPLQDPDLEMRKVKASLLAMNCWIRSSLDELRKDQEWISKTLKTR
jgi:hypothetical protein